MNFSHRTYRAKQKKGPFWPAMVSRRICFNHGKFVYFIKNMISFYCRLLNRHQLLVKLHQKPFVSNISEVKTSKLMLTCRLMNMYAINLRYYNLIFSGWIVAGNVLDYHTNRDEFNRKYKLAGIKRAIIEADEYIQSNQVSNILDSSVISLDIFLLYKIQNLVASDTFGQILIGHRFFNCHVFETACHISKQISKIDSTRSI